MIELNKNIQCPHCGNTNTIHLSDYVISEDTEERDMGAETEYTIECEEYACSVCKGNYSINGSIWEYPEGAYNEDSIKTLRG